MSASDQFVNCVRAFREKRGWSQVELAAKAGISRAGLSAIETGRLVPSAAAALSLARVFNCSVESLFQLGGRDGAGQSRWAWAPAKIPMRVWTAEVGGQMVIYPVEDGEQGCLPHDGVWDGKNLDLDPSAAAARTLVIGTCDPAAGLLAAELASAENIRLIAIRRSSQAALSLVAEGVVHGAGIHLADDRHKKGNQVVAAKAMRANVCLLHVADWEEGVAMRPGDSARDIKHLVQGDRRWVGRDVGSGARQCQDLTLAGHQTPRHTVNSHRAVADAIRAGWAEAGICLRLVSDQAGLEFLSVRWEPYDLCFSAEFATDARYAALLRVLRSARFRRLLSALPGYATKKTGEEIVNPMA
jgi:molybdate-binding protein/DNA-binding XRE family transcriptional regulator